jgi:hypothetical protein
MASDLRESSRKTILIRMTNIGQNRDALSISAIASSA